MQLPSKSKIYQDAVVPRSFLRCNTHFKKCKETIKHVGGFTIKSLKSNVSGFSKSYKYIKIYILPTINHISSTQVRAVFLLNTNEGHLCLHS